jgi:hypothetical protein
VSDVATNRERARAYSLSQTTHPCQQKEKAVAVRSLLFSTQNHRTKRKHIKHSHTRARLLLHCTALHCTPAGSPQRASSAWARASGSGHYMRSGGRRYVRAANPLRSSRPQPEAAEAVGKAVKVSGGASSEPIRRRVMVEARTGAATAGPAAMRR